MNAVPDLPDGVDERIARLIDDGVARHRRAQRTRGRLVVAVVLAVALIGGGGSAWVVVANHDQQTRSAYCYGADDTESRSTQVGIPDDMEGPDRKTVTVATPRDRVASAIDLCASVWKAGVLGAASDRALVACVRPDGVLAVFPRSAHDPRSDAKVCTDLGMGVAG